MGISWQQLLIILLIALLIFGAKKLRNVGSDIGAAVRGFKKAMNEGDEERRGELKHQGPDADFDNSRDPSRTDTSSADRDKNA